MLSWHYRHIFQKNGELCIKDCQLVLKTTKTTYLLHDHDKVKGNKLTCFCIDTLVSNSDLLCSVDNIVITMQCWKRKTSWRAFKSIHFEYAMNKDFSLGEFTTTSAIESCYHNFSSSMRKEWVNQRMKLIKCDCALINPTSCIVPGFHHVKLKNGRSCLSCF